MITRPALPLDVDAIVHNYKITSEKGDNVLSFEGKRLVRRGQKYWGVRSTITKNNFFEDVRGTFIFNKQYHNTTAALIKLKTGIVELNGDSFSITGAT